MMKRMIRKLSVFVMMICVLITLSVPVSASVSASDLVTDNAGLLSSSEISDLCSKAASLSNQDNAYLVILTTDGLGGEDIEQYEEDYYYDHFGSSASGLMLIVDMDSRGWNIMTFGDIDNKITGNECKAIGDTFTSDLSDGDYYDAFDQYLDTADKHLNMTQEERDEYADYDGSSSAFSILNILLSVVVSFVVALVIAFGMVNSMKKAMNTKVLQSGASEYIEKDSFKLQRKRDIFLYFNVTKTPKPKEDRSHDGGGSFDGHGSGGGSF